MKTRNNFLARCCSSRGQSLIEALALSFVAMAFISVFLGTLYFSSAHAGINYLLHEHLVCNATQQLKNCRGHFLKKSKIFLFLSEIKKIETFEKRGKYRGLVKIKMPLGREIQISKELDLYK
ncbi:MAG: hypothetical protein IPM97_10025 [Bdellovibrionaceae bacterium]|nr:hypothetical protein [Pseudobdellovibrionaceae bacterium]